MKFWLSSDYQLSNRILLPCGYFVYLHRNSYYYCAIHLLNEKVDLKLENLKPLKISDIIGNITIQVYVRSVILCRFCI